MSSSIFCSNCGQKHSISANFCTSCGNSLKSLTGNKSSSKSPNVIVIDPEDSGNQSVTIPHLDKLDVEITIPRRPKQTYGEIIKEGKTGFIRDLPAEVDLKKNLEELQKEGGYRSSRKSNSVEIGGGGGGDDDE